MSRQNTAAGLIEYACLRHERESAWVQIVTVWHRDPYPMTKGRRGHVGHRDAVVMAFSVATQYLDQPSEDPRAAFTRVGSLVDDEAKARDPLQTPELPWESKPLVLDGSAHPFLYLDLGGAWIGSCDLPALSIGIAGAGITHDEYGLVLVPISRYGVYLYD